MLEETDLFIRQGFQSQGITNENYPRDSWALHNTSSFPATVAFGPEAGPVKRRILVLGQRIRPKANSKIKSKNDVLVCINGALVAKLTPKSARLGSDLQPITKVTA